MMALLVSARLLSDIGLIISQTSPKYHLLAHRRGLKCVF
ncbi:hypothetical protein C1G86_0506 [Dehalococcoides mccartyi]|uniref:Uncharacterized protein n=1 Tax=Dehalococcoides mccartyi TaxID=61435 RepID=A0A328ELX2_9CHLR|nr:hypothetical protein C1G87_0517 [Dehalococcoides mccartyi]RAL70840.1 hypothetical protein C1G86_0506 [Dehalococcoides mccartyi]